MSVLVKRTIPLAITLIAGIVLVFEWFIPTSIGSTAGTGIREAGIIINAFAVMAAAVAFYLARFKQLAKSDKRSQKDMIFNVWMILIATTFIVVGISYGSSHDNYLWIYNSILLPLSATMYGNISWYIAAASYRVLRARSSQATVLLISGGILLLANTPMISALWLGPSQVGDWIMTNITQTAYRGILIGTAFGLLAGGVRTLIGQETGWLGRTSEGEN